MVSAYAEVEKRGLQKGIELGKAQMKNAFADGENKNRRDNAGRMLKEQDKSSVLFLMGR